MSNNSAAALVTNEHMERMHPGYAYCGHEFTSIVLAKKHSYIHHARLLGILSILYWTHSTYEHDASMALDHAKSPDMMKSRTNSKLESQEKRNRAISERVCYGEKGWMYGGHNAHPKSKSPVSEWQVRRTSCQKATSFSKLE